MGTTEGTQFPSCFMSLEDVALRPDEVSGEAIEILFVPLSRLNLDRDLWQQNAKKHEIKKLLESIERYGFIDVGKWDRTLNDGSGGFVYGNGRTKAIVAALLEAQRTGEKPPRGIPVAKDSGEWCIPVKFGVDAVTQNEAVALAIDHNNLTMLGGDFNAADIAKMWDTPAYISLLKTSAEAECLPVSVEAIDLADLLLGTSPLSRDTYEGGDREGEGLPSENYRESSADELVEEDDFDVDAVNEPDYVPRVKPGEIWKLGRHYIACGDCTIASNVKKLFNGRSAQLIHADPPYGMGKEKDGIANDNLYRSKLDAFQMLWWNEGRKHLDENGSVYIWGNAEDLWRLWFVGGLKDSERLTFRNQVVWDKESGQGMRSADHRMYPTATEHCLFFMRGEQGFNNNADNYWDGWDQIVTYLDENRKTMGWGIKDTKRIAGHSENSGCHWFDKSQWSMPTEAVYKSWQVEAKGKAFKREYEDIKREYEDIKREWYSTRAYFNNTHDNMTDVWKYPRVKGEERWGHATPKPTVMMQRVYKSSCPVDGLIYSPFLGSGSDLIAAEQLGDRTVIGFELSEKYCSLICDRWEKLTGGTAEKVGGL